MIVDRRTFHVPAGQVESVLQMLENEIRDHGAPPHGYRVCASETGEFNQVVMETEYENMAEMEAHWADWGTKPTTAAFMERWNAITLPGSSRELWRVVLQG